MSTPRPDPYSDVTAETVRELSAVEIPLAAAISLLGLPIAIALASAITFAMGRPFVGITIGVVLLGVTAFTFWFGYRSGR